MRAKRAGVIVGRSTGYLTADAENGSHGINDDATSIDYR